MNSNLGNPASGTFFTTSSVVTGVTGQTAKTFSATPAGTGAVMQFCIKGKAYNKAAISGGALPTTDAITGAAFAALAASQGCVYLLGLDSGGNIKAAAGNIQSLDGSGNFVARSEFPASPDTIAWFCYIVCKNGATGSAWTFATSNWDATGMTATPVNILTVPARPQVS